MHRPTASRGIVGRAAVLGATLLALCLPSGVAASAPTRTTSDSTLVRCVLADLGGTSGLLRIFIDEPDPGIAVLEYDDLSVMSGAATVTASADRSSIAASIDLWTFDPSQDPPFGTFLGAAAVSLDLTVRETLTFEGRFKAGNQVKAEEGTVQLFDVSGSLTLPDQSVVAIEAGDCIARRSIVTRFDTNPASDPASFQATIRETLFQCDWDTPLGPVELFVRSLDITGGQGPSGTRNIGRAVPGQYTLWSQEVLFIGGTDWLVFADNDLPDVDVGGRSISYDGTFSIWDADDPEDAPSGSAAASATLTPVAAIGSIYRVPGQTDQFHGHLLSVDGTLVIEKDGVLSLPMDDESCFAIRGRNSQHWVTSGG